MTGRDDQQDRVPGQRHQVEVRAERQLVEVGGRDDDVRVADPQRGMLSCGSS
ncbi:hypothetical protein SMD44_08816 [Streptomyces alboflavus]|uniref:Uncharacterized protein n=1 Tax=Streptomyces alboflavus TaxID=67267 RepID=A0A1Z1WSG3_9ACTN|nr:hypothetical protein SMD44_08816 [Streptomyces alboflavus]